MAKKQRILVVGLGVLGESIARELQLSGAEVIVLDDSPERIDAIKDSVGVALVADATDRKTLLQLDLASLDAAVVCIGEQFEAAVLTTVHLVDLKIPRVVARAHNELAADILRKLGAHEVFFVESEMGEVIAHRVLHRNVLNEMDLGDDYKVVQARCPAPLAGRKLGDLRLPDRYDIFVVAVRGAQEGARMRRPTAETVLAEDDLLLLTGESPNLEKFLRQNPDPRS